MFKRIAIVSVALWVICPVYVFAAGYIGVYADPAGTDCDVVETQGLVSVWVVLLSFYQQSHQAVRFAAPRPPCMKSTWLSDSSWAGPSAGDTQTGMTVSFGGCLSGTVAVVAINYFGTGETVCCWYPTIDNGADTVAAMDCGGAWQEINPRTNVVNGNGTDCCCGCGPVEESSWGAIKSLFDPLN